MGAGAELTVDPNPAVEGDDIEVSYTGDREVYYSVDGGSWEKLPLDGDGHGTLKAPVGAESVLFSDRDILNGAEEYVEVFSTTRR